MSSMRVIGRILGGVSLVAGIGVVSLSAGCSSSEGPGSQGTAGAGCYPNGTCNSGLACTAGTCGSGGGSSSSGGGASFAGSYSGSLSVEENGGPPTTVSITSALTQNGNTVDLNWSSCPGLNATASGNVATINTTSCPVQDGYTTTYTGGTLTLNGDSLVVDMTEDVNGNGVSVSGKVTGTLTTGGGTGGGSGCETTGTFMMGQPCNDPTGTMSLAMTLTGSTVSIQRSPVSGPTDSCTYTGTMAADCTSASGTFVCVGAGGGGGSWSATISGTCTTGGGCGLGTSWAEQEAYPGTSGNCSTFVLQ